MALIKQLLIQESSSIIQRRRVTRAHPFEELDQCSLSNRLVPLQIPHWFLAEGGGDEQAVRIIVYILQTSAINSSSLPSMNGESGKPSLTAAIARKKMVIGTTVLAVEF